MTHAFIYYSPIGLLLIKHTGQQILEIQITPSKETLETQIDNKSFTIAQKQLDEYFAGKRTQFSVPFQLQGTSFQKKVYQALLKIPYGKTQSYADIARIIGHDRAYRAVGSANHVNRLPIIIPCHRVIGSNGKLVGFRGGLEIKSWILAHEQQHKKNF